MAEEAKLQQLKNEYTQILGKIAEIDQERREHTLVLDTLNKQPPEKKCWRLLGGVLVEKTVNEIAPSIGQNID
jgi:prefoldin subunit 2